MGEKKKTQYSSVRGYPIKRQGKRMAKQKYIAINFPSCLVRVVPPMRTVFVKVCNFEFRVADIVKEFL